MKNLKKILRNPLLPITKLWEASSNLIKSDKLYLSVEYALRFKRRLNLDNPQSYNEKLQWLKLYDRNSLYIELVDKYAVKQYVTNLIGPDYVIPLLGVWNSPDDIDFEKLPNQFVLKCTHDSGGLIICRDKKKFNKEAAKKQLRNLLKNDFYFKTREWPYKNVPHKIIAEKYMVDESGYELKDYKFFCFNGVPKFCFIACDRDTPNEETKFNFYDMNFNLLPFTNGHPNSTEPLKKPIGFEQMKELAALMSKGIPHVRIDFYDINGHVYFGEFTFYHWSGFVPFEPDIWDYKIGALINLPTNPNLQ